MKRSIPFLASFALGIFAFVHQGWADGEASGKIGYVGSSVRAKSNINIGSVYYGSSNSMFSTDLSDHVWRNGFELGGSFYLPEAHGTHHPAELGTRGMIDVRLQHASGSTSSNGNATNGVGGVTQVGLPLLYYDSGSFGSGVFTGNSYYNLSSNVRLKNTWTYGSVAYRETLYPHGEDSVKVEGGIGIFYENFQQDWTGSGQITGQTGSTFGQQSFESRTDNNYIGALFSIGAKWKIHDGAYFKLRSEIAPSYYTAKASAYQTTWQSSSSTSQMLDFNDSGLTVAGGVRGSLYFNLTENAYLDLFTEWSALGGLPEINVSTNPYQQGASIDGNNFTDRWFFGINVGGKFNYK